jgi:hypothetical protein
MGGATVGEIVTVHTGKDDIAQSPARNRFGGIFGFVNVERRRSARCLD